VVKQQQFDYGYVFGAVSPSNDNTQALISPLVNKEVMKQHPTFRTKFRNKFACNVRLAQPVWFAAVLAG
jgi:hypothetical protein